MAAGIFKGKLTAIIDSSPVHGAGAVADTYELVRGFLRQVVRGRRRAPERRGPDRGRAVLRGQARHRLAGPGRPQGPPRRAGGRRDGPAGRGGRHRRPGRARAGRPAGPGASTKTSSGDDDGDPEIRQGVARDRVISHSDPEMRHGRKSASRRFDGHKLDVIGDEDSELVLGVDVRAGNAPDGEGAVPLLGQVQGVDGVEVETLLGDMAYSDGDVREAVEEAGAELVAKVPPVTNSGRFPKTDFADRHRRPVRSPAPPG